MDMMIVGCSLMLVAMLVLPGPTSQAARSALAVWGLEVAPSLFPYMVLCRTLSARLCERQLPAHQIASVLGLLGGSPSGAAAVASCAEKNGLSRNHILCLAALTGTLSPMFLLSTVREWTGDATLCRLLLISHLLGALFAYTVVRLYTGKPVVPPLRGAAQTEASASGNPIVESVQAILSVGGCIVFFSVVASAMTLLIPGMGANVSAVLHAVLEIAGGMRSLVKAPMPSDTRAVLMAAASGFSGLSILSQNLLFLKPHGISMRDLLALAFLRCVGCAAAMACLINVIPL